jgi:hypothetical protein
MSDKQIHQVASLFELCLLNTGAHVRIKLGPEGKFFLKIFLLWVAVGNETE